MVEPTWHKYLKFRCTGCGNCCRNTVVCLTDADVKRIVEGTGKSPLDFVCFYSHDQVYMSQKDPSWIRLARGKRVMALRSNGDHCTFLDDKTNRCTIYEHRPVTCRDHPFNVTFSNTGAVEKITLSRIVPCPHEWDGQISRRTLRASQSLNERQEESYVHKVHEWNRRKTGPRTGLAFLRFLGFDV